MNYPRTLMVVTPYYPPAGGGLETYVQNLVHQLIQKYHWRVVIITSTSAKRILVNENHERLTIFRLPILFTLSNTPINPWWPIWIKNIIRKTKPCLINIHAPVPFMADMTSLVADNIPLILTYHTGTMKKGRLIPDIGINLYEKYGLPLMLKKSKMIICPSKFVKQTMLESVTQKTTVISPAVDFHYFHPSPHRKYHQKVVLFIGRYANMYRMKGLPYLISAIKKLPQEVHLRVVGEPLSNQGSQITFVGVKQGQDLLMEIQNASLLVLPALTNIESFGMVLLEAMACGIPVIGTRTGGISEIIHDGINGILIPPKDEIALTQAIRQILDDPLVAKSMGNRGREHVSKHFTWESRAEITHHTFLKALTS
jgi:glycosyltransferase involved in cell wall biosynthesis